MFVSRLTVFFIKYKSRHKSIGIPWENLTLLTVTSKWTNILTYQTNWSGTAYNTQVVICLIIILWFPNNHLYLDIPVTFNYGRYSHWYFTISHKDSKLNEVYISTNGTSGSIHRKLWNYKLIFMNKTDSAPTYIT